MTIDKTTVLGTSLLKNITYNAGTLQSTSGFVLGTLYTQNVIEFATLTANSIRFELTGLPTHYRVFTRVRAYTKCASGQNTSIQVTLDANAPTIVTLPSSVNQIVETLPVDHNAASLIVTIQFGTQT
jgi:hypothetical protein